MRPGNSPQLACWSILAFGFKCYNHRHQLQVGRFNVVHICSLTGHPSRLCVRTFTTSIKGTNAWRAIPTNIYDTTWLKPRRKVRALRDGRESGSRNHIIRLSVENFNLLNYLSIYTCRHSSSVIALISEDLLGKFIDLHHLRMALSVTPNFLPI